MLKLEKLKNLTPHSITLCGNEKVIIQSDGIIRVSETSETITEIKGVKVIKKTLSDIPKEAVNLIREILKDSEAGVIVSMITAKALKKILSEKEQERVFIIGKTIRDDQGRIIGADSIAPIKFI